MPKMWEEEEERRYRGKKSKLKKIKEICKDRNIWGGGQQERPEEATVTWNIPQRKREMGNMLGGNEEEVMPYGERESWRSRAA